MRLHRIGQLCAPFNIKISYKNFADALYSCYLPLGFFRTINSFSLSEKILKASSIFIAAKSLIRVYYVISLAICGEVVKFSCNDERSGKCVEERNQKFCLQNEPKAKYN